MTDSQMMEGIWWLPETPEHRVAGSLAISATGGAELSLIGSLTSFLDSGVKHVEGDTTTISFTEASLARSGRYRRILGLSGQKHITLENCLQAHRGGIFGGVESERIHIGLVFVGLHFEVDEETRFTAVNTHMDHLIDWLQLSGLEESFDTAALAGKGRVAEVGLSRIPEKRVRLDDEAVLKLGQTFRIAGDLVRSRSIKQDFYMSIEYKALQTLDTLLSRLRDFQDLVTIGTDRVAGYAEVSVNPPRRFPRAAEPPGLRAHRGTRRLARQNGG